MATKRTIIQVNENGTETVVGVYNRKIDAYKKIVELVGDHIVKFYDKNKGTIYEVYPHDGEEKVTYILQ